MKYLAVLLIVVACGRMQSQPDAGDPCVVTDIDVNCEDNDYEPIPEDTEEGDVIITTPPMDEDDIEDNPDNEIICEKDNRNKRKCRKVKNK